MKFTFTALILLSFINVSFSQCDPDPDVIALGDPESDGVLNPHFLEVQAGQEVNLTVTVLSPPGGEGEVGGFLSVPYTMNYFIVKRLDNMPSWVTYDCPNDCKFDVDEYSCVQVSGTAPNDVPVGDSTVMNVIVDANVDASWGFLTWDDYTVEDEDGGTLSIRYIETPNSIGRILLANDIIFENGVITINTNERIKSLNIYNLYGSIVKTSINNRILSISEQPKGIYVVEVNTNNSSVVKKIVKH